MYGADMTEEELQEKLAEMEAAPTCFEVCEMVEYVKEHGTAAQLARACDVAENRGCSCHACNPTTPE